MSFDRIALHYRWIETLAFGNALQRARTCWLTDVPRPQRALVVGEGNGRFLCELLRVHPRIDVDCVDGSASMLHLARKRIERSCPESVCHVHFLCRDIRDWSPTHSYNLLVTHFFLDCFAKAEIEVIVAKLAAAAKSNAIWLLADFRLPQQAFARLHAAMWLCVMYRFFRLTTGISAHTIVDPTPLVVSNGLVQIKRTLSHWQMIKSDLYLARC